jgi:hypothetical protein
VSSPAITIDEILAEMSRGNPNGSTGGSTVTELCDKTGRAKTDVRNDIRKAIAAGRIECVIERRTGIDGRLKTVPAYRVVKPVTPTAKNKKK